MNSSCLQIFTKAPIEGYCKTRLIPHLGKKETVNIHMAMVQNTITMAKTVMGIDILLWCKPSKEHPFFQRLAIENDISLFDQTGESLGSIMKDAARQAATVYKNIIQIGTDCPYIDSKYLELSLESLNDDNPVVIGPATDGGYVLLAQQKYYPDIFNDIDWGTSLVLHQLESNLNKQGIQYSKLPVLNDIDTIDDYNNWINMNSIAQLMQNAQEGKKSTG